MYKDKDGKTSLSRTAYISTLVIVLFKMAVSGMEYQGFAAGVADLSGMAMILSATALTYYGSEKSKRETDV